MQKLMEFEARVTYSPGSNFMAGDRTVAIPEESIMYSSGPNCMCLHFRMLAKTVTGECIDSLVFSRLYSQWFVETMLKSILDFMNLKILISFVVMFSM